MTTNPYRGLEDYRFWSRGVTSAPPGQLDPMVGGPTIGAGDKVVTMGSCFAQHLARNLAGLGLNYHIAEPPPAGMAADEARQRNYGVFSARYGNVYTVRQALQLFDRAFGKFAPEDDVWEVEGGFVDAFRPQIEPVPLASAEAVRGAAHSHLASVRALFEGADWLIFTLGLTEGWRSGFDGAVYPVAPGVAGGSFDPGRYEFINFSADAVKRDLIKLVDKIKSVNPACRIILTVSPVPLIATYENRHVLTSTTVSKAVLRVAADEVERLYSHVTYFPSYEIITSPAAGGAYYEDDLRSIANIGVQHVMRVFRKHFVASGPAPAKTEVSAPAPAAYPMPGDDGSAPQVVICDEELIEKSIQESVPGMVVRPAEAAPVEPVPVEPELAEPPRAEPATPVLRPTQLMRALSEAEYASGQAAKLDIDAPKRPGLVQRWFGRT